MLYDKGERNLMRRWELKINEMEARQSEQVEQEGKGEVESRIERVCGMWIKREGTKIINRKD